MTKEELIRNLKYTMEKHKNDKVDTFETNISVMCKDVLDYLEQQTSDNCVSENQSQDFPQTFDEYANDYGFIDDKEIYTNGSHLIPVFRVQQWLEHKTGKWTGEEEGYYSECSCCGASFLWEDYKYLGDWKYCPKCGAKMERCENE